MYAQVELVIVHWGYKVTVTKDVIFSTVTRAKALACICLCG
jgi:hypothetical protein